MAEGRTNGDDDSTGRAEAQSHLAETGPTVSCLPPTTTMSATSGIGVSQELSDAFAAAVDNAELRFLKISIRNGRDPLCVQLHRSTTH